MTTHNDRTKSATTDKSEVVPQLVKPLDNPGVGTVFVNRVDNAGIAAVIVQRQKAELRNAQEKATARLEGVLKPALSEASTRRLNALTKALKALLPCVHSVAERTFAGLAVTGYSRFSIDLGVGGLNISYSADEGYTCLSVGDIGTLKSLDVFATIAMVWKGASFLDEPLQAFVTDERGVIRIGARVTGNENPHSISRVALARFELPEYVVAAIQAEKAARTAHDSVAGYIMDIRKVLQNSSELHEHALATLAEMSLLQTNGGTELLSSISENVRTAFAPKIPLALQTGPAEV